MIEVVRTGGIDLCTCASFEAGTPYRSSGRAWCRRLQRAGMQEQVAAHEQKITGYALGEACDRAERIRPGGASRQRVGRCPSP